MMRNASCWVVCWVQSLPNAFGTNEACQTGDSSQVQSKLTCVRSIQSSADAFTTLLSSDSMVSWGRAKTGGRMHGEGGRRKWMRRGKREKRK